MNLNLEKDIEKILVKKWRNKKKKKAKIDLRIILNIISIGDDIDIEIYGDIIKT